MFKRERGRGTDYVVCTSFVTDNKQNSIVDSTNRRRVSITLRFKNLLKRRNSEVERDKRHNLLLEDTTIEELRKGVAAFSTTKSKKHSNWLQSNIFNKLKRNQSDFCLKSIVCHPHLACTRPDLSPAPTSSGSDSTTEASYSQRDQLESNQRMQSLSTGNLCCLFALQCLPSMEFTDTSYNYPPPMATDRRFSVPTTSALKSPTGEDSFALHLLKHHPCYQDSRVQLGDWLKQALSHDGEGPSQTSLECVRKEEFHSSDYEDKHVRFADEANYSSSTLNSLSAASSTLSLSSLCPSLFVPSPLSSTSNINRLETGDSRQSLNSAVLMASPHMAKRDGIEFAKKSSKRFSKLRPLNLARKLWSNQKRKFTKSRKNNTPFVTVNVIKDYSEPPEVPKHVLRQLKSNRQPKTYWKPMFTNPNTCGNFRDNLMKNGVCLARLCSNSLHSINLEIHVMSPSPFDNDPPSEVKVRFTLNNWNTYSESQPFCRMKRKREQTSHNDSQWTEVYEGNVEPSWLQLTISNSTNQCFEFAVVVRRNGSEHWDNNEARNYVCQRYNTQCDDDIYLCDDSDFYD